MLIHALTLLLSILLLAVVSFAFITVLTAFFKWMNTALMASTPPPTVEEIDHILPQTQCGQCGFPGCRPYAEAILQGEVHNRCPPGGDAVILQLAQRLGRTVLPLNLEHGIHEEIKKVAYIREAECIGCTKCIQACPVDAILGAAKLMHTVIPDLCTGCDLCVEPCPVDCIEMRPVEIKPVELHSVTQSQTALTPTAMPHLSAIQRIPLRQL
jgi:Na+-translocating ferredoxin:NAD+ oxidoreductase subunit B